MKNYALEGCQELVNDLRNECSELYYQIEKSNYEGKANEKVINQYIEANQKYLVVKKQLEKMQECLGKQ